MVGEASGATPRSTFSVERGWQVPIGLPKKYKPRGAAPDASFQDQPQIGQGEEPEREYSKAAR